MSELPHVSGSPRVGVAPHPSSHPVARPKDDLSSVSVVGRDQNIEGKIKLVVPGAAPEIVYKRKPYVSGQGACRVRSFHGRCNDDGLRRIDEKINEWLDNHPEIDVKFAITTIGQWDDKAHEPAMMINVWW